MVPFYQSVPTGLRKMQEISMDFSNSGLWLYQTAMKENYLDISCGNGAAAYFSMRTRLFQYIKPL